MPGFGEIIGMVWATTLGAMIVPETVPLAAGQLFPACAFTRNTPRGVVTNRTESP